MREQPLNNAKLIIGDSSYILHDTRMGATIVETTQPGDEWASYRTGQRYLKAELHQPLTGLDLRKHEIIEFYIDRDGERLNHKPLRGYITRYERDDEVLVPTIHLTIDFTNKEGVEA